MLRLCSPVGTATATLLLPLTHSAQNSHASGLSTQSDEAFIRELQRRVHAATAAAPRLQSKLQKQFIPRDSFVSGSWQHKGRFRRGQLFKLATAAVAGFLALEVLREEHSTPRIAHMQQNAEAFVMAEMQCGLATPALRPGYLKVCSQWLQEREALLQAERSAWQILPPTVGQVSRIEEIDLELESTAVIMNAVSTTLQRVHKA